MSFSETTFIVAESEREACGPLDRSGPHAGLALSEF